jgi:non-ribosomal peptide synthase protein (TIGR01720 family)
LKNGPLLRAGWFELGGGERRLLVVIHHLVVDGVSWRILLQDLQALCDQKKRGKELQLPARSSSYGKWSEALEEYAGSEELQRELRYWEELASCEVLPLRRDEETGENREGTTETLRKELDAEQTRELLQEVPRAYHTQIQDVLVTALVRSVEKWNGRSGVLLDLEGHGREELREDLDLSRTVGWFTTIYPVYVRLGGEETGADMKLVKEQLRGVPKRGLGYGVLRYVQAEGRERLAKIPEAEMVFNYLGQFDRILEKDGEWTGAGESPGATKSGKGRRRYLLEVNSYVSGERLRIEWIYSKEIHRESTVGTLAEIFQQELRTLIAHCQTTEGGYTPADFPLAAVSQAELDRIIGNLKTSRKSTATVTSTS